MACEIFHFLTKFLRAYEFTQFTSVRTVEKNTNTPFSNKWIKASKSSRNIYASRKNDKNVVVARHQLSTAESCYFTFVFLSFCVCFVNFIYLFIYYCIVNAMDIRRFIFHQICQISRQINQIQSS